MSDIGFYRVKTVADTNKDIVLYVNGAPVATKQIKLVDSCMGDLIVKYLDRDGQYRFYPFSRFYETSDAPQKIGSTNKFLTNLLTDQTSQKNVGYKNQRQINATAEADAAQLEKLKDIYTSPRVYLYVGSGLDRVQDWIEVEIIASPAIVKRRRANFGYIGVTIILPEHYTITML